jgi:hypothetical protein
VCGTDFLILQTVWYFGRQCLSVVAQHLQKTLHENFLHFNTRTIRVVKGFGKQHFVNHRICRHPVNNFRVAKDNRQIFKVCRMNIRQILEKKWEYNETVHQLFIDFKKAYD